MSFSKIITAIVVVAFISTCMADGRINSPVTDGCKGVNTEIGDACLPVNSGEAGIRCCSKDDASNFCDSFCVDGARTLYNYSTAVATCEANNLRLCTREEIDAGDCCGTGCGFDGFQNWILETCPEVYLYVGLGHPSNYVVSIDENRVLEVSFFHEGDTKWYREDSTDDTMQTVCDGEPAFYIREADNPTRVLGHFGSAPSDASAISMHVPPFNIFNPYTLWCYSDTDNELTAAFTQYADTYHVVVRDGSYVELEVQSSLTDPDAKFFFDL